MSAAHEGPVGFDLDLTLINSRQAILTSWTAVAEELGVRIDLTEVDRRMGVKLEDEVSYWFGAEEQAAAAESYRRHYVRLAPGLTFLLPGAEEALAAVQSAGERAVIITAKHPVSVRPSLDAVGLAADDVFMHVHGPEKAVVLARLGAAVYVGDTPADMAAALGGGAVAVGVPTGSFTSAELLAAGAATVLPSLLEFPSWYADFRGAGGSGARQCRQSGSVQAVDGEASGDR